VAVVDTTGAGDAFNAGFLYGLIHDKSLFECGRLGNFVASRSVMKMGARDGLPHAEDLALI
jgi:ribokinase